MKQDRRAGTALDRLPGEVVDWLTKPFASFLRIEAAAGAILLALTIAALAISNSPWSHQFLDFWELPVGIQIGSLEAARSLRQSGRKFFPSHEQSGGKFRRVD
jgi:NhaA family Na+:H+ antiporter